ncbi:sigma 54-interacting transcriptional regulator [Variovorax paradoxus]
MLFLDEIAEMPLALQTRLLRVLEERTVRPLGGGQGVAVDFDLACATHGDLPALVAAGRFRADLMYRVAGFTVALPPLRERADRHALIARLFLESGAAARGLRLEDEALEALAACPWPGNVRELRSVLRSLVALAEPGDAIGLDALPANLRAMPGMPAAPVPDTTSPGFGGPPPLVAITRQAIAQALQDCGHDVAEAAHRLGIHRSTVYRHLARERGRRPGG